MQSLRSWTHKPMTIFIITKLGPASMDTSDRWWCALQVVPNSKLIVRKLVAHVTGWSIDILKNWERLLGIVSPTKQAHKSLVVKWMHKWKTNQIRRYWLWLDQLPQIIINCPYCPWFRVTSYTLYDLLMIMFGFKD